MLEEDFKQLKAENEQKDEVIRALREDSRSLSSLPLILSHLEEINASTTDEVSSELQVACCFVPEGFTGAVVGFQAEHRYH